MLGVVDHAFNTHTPEAKAGGFLWNKAIPVYIASPRPAKAT